MVNSKASPLPDRTGLTAGQGYKVIAVDIKQSSIDLASSYRWKPDVSVLATDPAENAVRRISEVVPGRYPGVDAAILATDGPAAFDFAAAGTQKHGKLVLVGQPDKGITLPYFIFGDLHAARRVADCGQEAGRGHA